MFCIHCGTKLEESMQACPGCGAPNETKEPAVEIVKPEQPVAACVPPAVSAPSLPKENSPLSAWTYFWLKVLFMVPVVGFVFLIVFSCSGANVNRRSFARSYWCGLLVLVIVLTIVVVLAFALGFTSRMFYYSMF